jgi:hypothetical protein
LERLEFGALPERSVRFRHTVTAAAGLDHPSEFSLQHFSRRVSASEVMTFTQLYPTLRVGELIEGTRDRRFADAWELASAESFRPVGVRKAA